MEENGNKARYSNIAQIENEELTTNEWIPIEESLINGEGAETGFYAVGSNENGWTIALCGHVVSSRTFESVDEATKYVKSRPWDLAFVAHAVYTELILERKRKIVEEKKVI